MLVARDASLTRLIAAHPGDALALAGSGIRLSYGRLNDRSRGLAQGLHLLGVGPDVPIAVFANRSPAAVLGALSVLKAGGCYVPLDPADPPERLEYKLRDLRTPFVLAERGIAGRLPQGEWRVIPLDEAPLIFSAPMHATPEPQPTHLACIVYTSGPGGHPVGVEITHASLMNLVQWHLRAFKVTANENAGQIAPWGSDAAMWETWTYLAAGASLHFPDAQANRYAWCMRDWLVDEYVTIAYAPADLAEELMDLEWPPYPALLTLLTGGVPRTNPPAKLPFNVVNTYGTPETTAVALTEMGRPIDNVRLAILNQKSEPVEVGQMGELCIGGAGLARGYFNQPELTARRFVPDLCSSQPQARLYRTGELVRRLPGGPLAFTGRLDDQITIRGFRIEPAEVEHALKNHPDLQDCVVVVRVDAGGRPCLVAYTVPAADHASESLVLDPWLRDRLPEYMIPTAFVTLSELPRKADGTVDRSALPEPPREEVLSMSAGGGSAALQ